jgi:hemerythrin superfamily protein
MMTSETLTQDNSTSSGAAHKQDYSSGYRYDAYDRSNNGKTSTGALIGAAAAGLAVGLAATVGRKAAIQAAQAASGDWYDALKQEHEAALAIFDKLEATTPQQTNKRGMLLMQLKNALQKHAHQEENVIYPALRRAGEAQEAEALFHDHSEVKQYLYELSIDAKDSSQWINKLREFRAAIEQHVREEEEEIFPRLRNRMNQEENHRLSMAMGKEGFKLA